MKNKKNIIIIIAIVLAVAIFTFVLYGILNDKNKLTVAERKWVNSNINTIQNLNVLNDIPTIGTSGSGVYYDFIKDFTDEYSMKINPITFNTGEVTSGLSLGIKRQLTGDEVVFLDDHFVVISKEKEIITNDADLISKDIGVLSQDYNYIATYLKNTASINFKQYDSITELYNNLDDGTVAYAIIPRLQNLEKILKSYNIIYHISDAKMYFVMQTDTSILSKVLVKFFNKWKTNINKYYNKALFKTFTSSLSIPDADIASMQSIEYNYAFVNSSPYEVIMGGKYGGIIAVILSDFSDFANVDFNFNKYSNYNKFKNAISKGGVDLYFNYYNTNDGYNNTEGLNINYAVIAKRNDSTVIKSINSLVGKTVYVEQNSKLEEYLKTINGINIKTYNKISELKSLKNNAYVLIDKNTFEYYSNNKLNNYTERFTDTIKSQYNFRVRTNSTLFRLLDKYMSFIDKDEITIKGLDSHYVTVKNGTIITNIAEYIIYIVIVIIIVILLLLKRSKKVTIAKKIKKEDKMKYIDQLTSLKNRNYLNENISTWSNNTIYPQTVIVIDLNKIQEINDQYGYNEGDRQIRAMSNILVRTQLDNSEIMRTDGNEFVLYLVGYTRKQISNYIHKLNKELKKLPYEHGAEFGYSIIEDDIKTIEDALNEAVEDMKKQKGMHDEN